VCSSYEGGHLGRIRVTAIALSLSDNVRVTVDTIFSTEAQRHRGEEDQDPLTREIIAAAIEVHRALGPGLVETVYEQCLCHELHLRGLSFRRQVDVPAVFKGIKLDCGHRLDLVVEDKVVLELKSVDRIDSVHLAQLLTYLKLTGLEVGLLINFNVEVLRNGIKRRVNKPPTL
jgi:GxxExxY protein